MVYIVNLTAPGSTALRALKESARLVADACAHNPCRTCAIFISPSVASHGHTYDEIEVQKVQDEAETFLRQDLCNMRVRRGQFVFTNESINSRARASVHPLLMCVSGQVNDEAELVSLFCNSQLWHRRAVTGIKMKSNAEYVVPLHGHTVITAENLSNAQLHKQHISGVDLMDKLKELLWKGMNLSRSMGQFWWTCCPQRGIKHCARQPCTNGPPSLHA